ncbi:MAG: NAD(P)H-binding protein [Polyangiales bacterium]
MPEILVLGASGNVGGRLVRLLGSRGERVRAASREPAGLRGATSTVALDLERPETFGPALVDVDRVFMMARPGDEQADVFAQPLIEAMREAGVRHVVNLTAMGADEADHVAALRRTEAALESSGLAFTHLRPGFFMQLFSAGPLHQALMTTGVLQLPAARAQISFIDAEDVAEVAARAFMDRAHEFRAYTLTGAEALDHAQAVEHVSRATGKVLRYEPIEESEVAPMLAPAGFTEARIERFLRFYRLVREGAAGLLSEDVPRILGRPATRFRDFALRERASWL